MISKKLIQRNNGDYLEQVGWLWRRSAEIKMDKLVANEPTTTVSDNNLQFG